MAIAPCDSSWCDGVVEAAGKMPGVPADAALAFHVAAARELFEEAGVLLGRDATGQYVSLADPADHDRFMTHRAELNAGRRTLRAIVEAEQLRLALDALVHYAHWVTPPVDIRRFDTRFFVTRVPPHADARGTDDQAAERQRMWIRPAEAIAAAGEARSCCRRRPGRRFASSSGLRPSTTALPWAGTRTVYRRSRGSPCVADGTRRIVLPGDPSLPEPEPVAFETRFVLAGGTGSGAGGMIGAGTERRGAPHAGSTGTPLRRALGFRDLLFFYIVTTFSLRWIATPRPPDRARSSSGSSRRSACSCRWSLRRSSSRRGIRKKAASTSGASARLVRSPAFITGWSYWATNLPYFPSLLYFAAGNLLFVGGPSWQAWSSNSMYFMTAAMIGLTFAVVAERRRARHRQMAEQRRRRRGVDRRRLADRARAPCPGLASDRRRRSTPRRCSEHEPEGRDLLVDDRVCVRRRGERVDDGRGDSRRRDARFRAPSSPRL